MKKKSNPDLTGWIESPDGQLMRASRTEHEFWRLGYKTGVRVGRENERFEHIQYGPPEPQEVQKARAEIEEKWAKEFQYAENLRTALRMIVSMCDESDAKQSEIHDLASDALTDKPSSRLLKMRNELRRPERRDRLVDRHMYGGTDHLPPIHEDRDIPRLKDSFHITLKPDWVFVD